LNEDYYEDEAPYHHTLVTAMMITISMTRRWWQLWSGLFVMVFVMYIINE